MNSFEDIGRMLRRRLLELALAGSALLFGLWVLLAPEATSTASAVGIDISADMVEFLLKGVVAWGILRLLDLGMALQFRQMIDLILQSPMATATYAAGRFIAMGLIALSV